MSYGPETKPPRTTREFLHEYRTRGLPNAKKFRKATKIARLNQEAEMLHTMFRDLASRVASALLVVDKVADESNWAVRPLYGERGEELDETEVLWVADVDPLEALKLLRKTLDPNNSIPIRKAGDVDGRDPEPASSGHGEHEHLEPAANEGEPGASAREREAEETT